MQISIERLGVNMPMRRVWHFCACDGQCWVSAFDDWQTMIAALLALGAAYVAYTATKSQADIAREQLKAQQDQYWRDRAGRLRAARASLPLVLSGICDYAESSVRALRNEIPPEHGMFRGDANIHANNIFVRDEIKFPVEYVEVLEKMIEFSPDDAASKSMEGLIREIQVFQARWRSFRNEGVITSSWLGNLIYEACVIRARAEILFNYARGREADVNENILWERVFTAMMSLNVDQFHIVYDIAKEQHENKLAPGEADRPLEFD